MIVSYFVLYVNTVFTFYKLKPPFEKGAVLCPEQNADENKKYILT